MVEEHIATELASKLGPEFDMEAFMEALAEYVNNGDGVDGAACERAAARRACPPRPEC